MPTKRLPNSADIGQLEHQAKDLLDAFRTGDMAACQRVREFHSGFQKIPDHELHTQTFSLSDAKLSIAKEYGYENWSALKTAIAENHQEELTLTHNERIPDGAFKQALDFIDEGNEQALIQHLKTHPDLVHEEMQFDGGNYFATPTLIEFVPENPTRLGRLPKNAVKITEILLDAGAKDNQEALDETVMLAASGRVCREHGVQDPLIRLLCNSGADPSAGMHSALAHSELDAARVLVACGAPLDLSTAAALNDEDAVHQLIGDASADERQLALALCATIGQANMVSVLLDAGADPNQYNPPGGHSHCTPLHSAVSSNLLDTVKVLVKGGARLDIKDIHHNMTALGWAQYMDRSEIISFLKTHATE